MNPPLTLIWMQGDNSLKDVSLTFPVSVPGVTYTFTDLSLQSSALQNFSYDVLKNVVVYLDTDSTTLTALDGLIFISLDQGITFQPFGSTPISMPASAVGASGANGTLGPFDRAKIQLKLSIPDDFNTYQLFNFSIGVDFDTV